MQVAISSGAWSAVEPPFGWRQRPGLAAERIVWSVALRSQLCVDVVLQPLSWTRAPDLRALPVMSMHLPSERSDLSAVE